jgi:hypothetical protein
MNAYTYKYNDITITMIGILFLNNFQKRIY